MKWIKQLFSSSDGASIKRLVGFILILVLISVIYFTGLKWITIDVWEKIEPFCEKILYSVWLFFGLNTFIDFNKIKSGLPTDITKDKTQS